MATYNVRISEYAKIQIGSLIDYLSIRDKEAALQLKDLILDKIRKLETFPKQNPVVNAESNFWKKYYKLVVNKNCIVLYQVDEANKAVYVEHFIDPNKIPIES